MPAPNPPFSTVSGFTLTGFDFASYGNVQETTSIGNVYVGSANTTLTGPSVTLSLQVVCDDFSHQSVNPESVSVGLLQGAGSPGLIAAGPVYSNVAILSDILANYQASIGASPTTAQQTQIKTIQNEIWALTGGPSSEFASYLSQVGTTEGNLASAYYKTTDTIYEFVPSGAGQEFIGVSAMPPVVVPPVTPPTPEPGAAAYLFAAAAVFAVVSRWFGKGRQAQQSVA